jgi:hypothetical protein
MDRTKWDILVERRDQLRLDLERLERELKGLSNTNCGLNCSGCGQHHETEADFAKHYLIPDERYLNLGYCPNKDTGSRTHTP